MIENYPDNLKGRTVTEAELAEIIDIWYCSWVDRLVDFKRQVHSFGFAKEDLKRRIADHPFYTE